MTFEEVVLMKCHFLLSSNKEEIKFQYRDLVVRNYDVRSFEAPTCEDSKELVLIESDFILTLIPKEPNLQI